jgi:hypothetical protein
VVDVVGIVAGWAEKLLGGWRRRRATDRRIADRAKLLRRTLEASFEDWPGGLKDLNDLVRWAGRLAVGFPTTEPALKELVDLRPDASAHVERGVGTARDEYYAAADIVNRLFRGGGLSIEWDERPAVEAKLRTAATHVHKCIVIFASIEVEQQ